MQDETQDYVGKKSHDFKRKGWRQKYPHLHTEKDIKMHLIMEVQDNKSWVIC